MTDPSLATPEIFGWSMCVVSGLSIKLLVSEYNNFFSVNLAVASSFKIIKSYEPIVLPETFSLINCVCTPDQ